MSSRAIPADVAHSPRPNPTEIHVALLRNHWTQLALVTLTAAAAVYARTAMYPLQESMRVSLGFSDQQIALLQGPALALPMLLVAIPLGLAIGRYSRVVLLFIFAILAIVASTLTAALSTIESLILARSLGGLCAAATSITAYSLVGDLFAPSQRGRATMIVAIGEIAGFAAAFAVGGAASDYFAGQEGWRRAMLWLTAPLLPLALLLFAVKEPARANASTERVALADIVGALRGLGVILIAILIGRVMVAIADSASGVWAAPLFVREFRLSEGQTGAILGALFLASGVIGPLIGGLTADNCQKRGGVRGTSIAMSLMLFVCAVASTYALLPHTASSAALLFVTLVVNAAVSVMVTAMVITLVPSPARGLCISIMVTCSVVFGVGLGPVFVSLATGSFGEELGLRWGLSAVCVASAVVGVLAFAVAAIRPSRTSAEIRESGVEDNPSTKVQ